MRTKCRRPERVTRHFPASPGGKESVNARHPYAATMPELRTACSGLQSGFFLLLSLSRERLFGFLRNFARSAEFNG
jgi:hypothetical protein